MSVPKLKIDMMSDPIGYIADVVSEISGVQFGDNQKFMIESRLHKRIRELSLGTSVDYVKYLQAHYQVEIHELVSLLTTHHTFFFREFKQFEHLKEILPQAIENMKKRGDQTLRVWSAACSRGQEVYSLAMFLDFHLKAMGVPVNFFVLGSDVDIKSVEFARNGVYSRNEIKEIPLNYLGNNWARGMGEISHYVKVRNELKKHCHFEPGNLFNIDSKYFINKFDFIFCRNVFIYFNFDQIKQITSNLLKVLHPKGSLFLGLSESLNNLSLPVRSSGPSVYSHTDLQSVPLPKQTSVSSSVPSSATPRAASSTGTKTSQKSISGTEQANTKPAEPLKVFCVDDSPTILTLLQKILTPDNGFQVVGIANNGLDASKKIPQKPVDIVTLDIHMPEMDGITYLSQFLKGNHPPIVMITSVSRENADLALKALHLGASDYIEKPALSNLMERSDEIRTKLKSAIENYRFRGKIALKVDDSFKTKWMIKSPENKARVILGSLGDMKKMIQLVREQVSPQNPPLYIFMEGVEPIMDEFAKQVKIITNTALHVSLPTPDNKLGVGVAGLFDFQKTFDHVVKKYSQDNLSIMALGRLTQKMEIKLKPFVNAQILLEDRGVDTLSESKVSSWVQVPLTSFTYMSDEYLGGALAK